MLNGEAVACGVKLINKARRIEAHFYLLFTEEDVMFYILDGSDLEFYYNPNPPNTNRKREIYFTELYQFEAACEDRMDRYLLQKGGFQ